MRWTLDRSRARFSVSLRTGIPAEVPRPLFVLFAAQAYVQESCQVMLCFDATEFDRSFIN